MTSSRIDHARRRLAAARVSIAAVAVSAFVAFAVAARISHPGSGGHTSATTSGASTTVQSSDGSTAATDDGTSFFDSGSFGSPGSSVPQVQSGGS